MLRSIFVSDDLLKLSVNLHCFIYMAQCVILVFTSLILVVFIMIGLYYLKRSLLFGLFVNF